jgi:hypothetical protein
MLTKTKDAAFFARLYSGFEAEYFVMGKLFGAGLEAFKLPADFGFDLLVTNQKELNIGPVASNERVHAFPYVLQVKSRRIKPTDYGEGPNDRIEVVVNFRISKTEFEMLTTEDRGYLVCVAFLPIESGALGEKALYFWLKGSQLSQLKEHSYLLEVNENGKLLYDLKAAFRFRPTQTRESLIKRLVEDGQLTSSGAKVLEDLLPKEIGVSSNANEYVAFYRCHWTRSEEGYYGDRTIAKQLHAPHLELSKIGEIVVFPTDDNCESFPKLS